jgi:hypothetical protein
MLQQAVVNAFQLGRIDNPFVATLLVRTLNGFDAALQQGRVLQALAQLLLFRVEVQLLTGDHIRDTGFAELLLLDVDKLLGRILSSVLS